MAGLTWNWPARHCAINKRRPCWRTTSWSTPQGIDSTPLAGSFVLSLTPDDNGLILYTPYDGIKKFDSLVTLTNNLNSASTVPPKTIGYWH